MLAGLLTGAQGEKHPPVTDLWSFQAVKPITPPPAPASLAKRVKSPIDQFVFARLTEEHLTPNPQADKRTLLRRACFDLTGLPPTQEQVQIFMADESAEAFSKLIDRLLASTAYGERWGRYWLDQARYADTTGDATDMPIPEARHYRDYVIDAFNNDLPYDEFIREQLAGDLTANDNDGARWEERTIATGFIALSRRYGNGKFADKHLIVENSIETLGRAMLGMTFACARCHDHKFDPVSMKDYYGLYGYFNGIKYPHAGTEHARYQENMVVLEKDPKVRQQYTDWQEKLSKAKDELKRVDKKRRSDKSQELTDQSTALKDEIKSLTKNRPKVRLAWAVSEDPEHAKDQRIHLSGDPGKQGETAPRGFIQVVAKKKADIPPENSGRLVLANWIASAENPLTSRVMANRIWQYHFGKGIVASSSTFGSQGDTPTHPELLDWLAHTFVKENWSIKAMHRKIMNSATYQLSSIAQEKHVAQDGDNRLLWRFDRQRLDGEAIRDAILATSGKLIDGPPPPHPFPDRSYEKFSQGSPFATDYDTTHRSVYMMTRRNGKHPYWELFDAPNRGQSTAYRHASTVPMQALFMMNSTFIKDNARAFADRINKNAQEPADRIRLAYATALGREATDDETADALAYIQSVGEEHGWNSFCRTLFASNEFIFID